MQRKIYTIDIPQSVRPESVRIHTTGELEIIWQPDGHRSRFDAPRLRALCYSCTPCREARLRRGKNAAADQARDLPARKPWRGADLASVDLDCEYEQLLASDTELLRFLEILLEFGVGFVRNVAADGITTVGERLAGYIRRTNYYPDGGAYDVISEEQPNNISNTQRALKLHTDTPYFDAPPGFQALHCVRQTSGNGGDSMFVDSFSICQEFAELYPDEYRLLRETSLNYRFVDRRADYDLRFRAPMVEHDTDGNWFRFRHNDQSTWEFDAPFETMPDFYRAYQHLTGWLEDEQRWHRRRLASGDMVLTDNYRVLHARTAFDSGRGERYMRTLYVDQDEVHSRYWRLTRS